MDARKFDRITRALSVAGTRRGVIQTLTAFPVTGVLAALVGGERAGAEHPVDRVIRRKTRRHSRHHTHRHKHKRSNRKENGNASSCPAKNASEAFGCAGGVGGASVNWTCYCGADTINFVTIDCADARIRRCDIDTECGAGQHCSTNDTIRNCCSPPGRGVCAPNCPP